MPRVPPFVPLPDATDCEQEVTSRAAKQIASLKQSLTEFRTKRVRVKREAEEEIPQEQVELIAALRTADPENKGVVIEFDGREERAYVQQNSGTEFWDTENIIAYLKKRPTLWRSCSSRTFDVAKWEAEVAAGNVSPKTAAKFKKTAPPPKPFIAFGKPKPESLR